MRVLTRAWTFMTSVRAGALNYVLAGFLLIWLVYERSGALLTSALKETGVIVLLLVTLSAYLVETLGFRYYRTSLVFRALGYKNPSEPSMRAALLIAMTMLLFIPALSLASGTRFGLEDNWPWIAFGIFAQAGLAQELVFRGYLFHHLRRQYPFQRVALIAAIPFVLRRILMFGTADTASVVAGIVIAAATAFPLALLYERGNQSIWPGALVSGITQAALQIVIIPSHLHLVALVGWTIVASLVPWLAYALLGGSYAEQNAPQTEYVRAREW
jgi:membrane protease YdiL (CAAX protease family)